MSIQPSAAAVVASTCPKCRRAMIPLSQVHVGIDGKLAPRPDAAGILNPAIDAERVEWMTGYGRDMIVISIFFRLVGFILDGIARLIFMIGAGAGAGAKNLRLSQTLRRYPRSLYCPQCRAIQRRF